MGKVNKTFSLDLEVLTQLEVVMKEVNVNASKLVERYIKEGLSRDSYVSLICPKCGASYSSKLAECPGCKVNNLKKVMDTLGMKFEKVQL